MSKFGGARVLRGLRTLSRLTTLANSSLCRKYVFPCRFAIIERRGSKAPKADIELAQIKRLTRFT